MAAASSVLVIGLLISGGDEKAGTVVPLDGTTTTEPSVAVEPAAAGSTSPPPVGLAASGEEARSPVAASPADGREPLGSTEDCRNDPGCPSSEHRTSDPCGAAIIADTAGYLEGRHDAEDGLPYEIDQAPAPGPADDDDDDATVGPETRHRAGYVQGWCDGGGAPASSP